MRASMCLWYGGINCKKHRLIIRAESNQSRYNCVATKGDALSGTFQNRIGFKKALLKNSLFYSSAFGYLVAGMYSTFLFCQGDNQLIEL